MTLEERKAPPPLIFKEVTVPSSRAAAVPSGEVMVGGRWLQCRLGGIRGTSLLAEI
jgi:hypothetical protein